MHLFDLSSSFSTCRHDCGRDCRSAVLCGDHYCDVVWWSELGGAALDVVRGRRGRSSAELAIGDGVGAVGKAFAAAGVLVVVVGLCGDLTWTCTKYQMLCNKR